MALTIGTVLTKANREPAVDLRAYDLTLDNSYPAGGYAITPATFQFANELVAVIPLGSPQGYFVIHDPLTATLRVFRTGTALSGALQEAPNATDLSAVKVRILVVGR